MPLQEGRKDFLCCNSSCAIDRLAMPTRSTHTLHLTLDFQRKEEKQMLPNQTPVSSVLPDPSMPYALDSPNRGRLCQSSASHRYVRNQTTIAQALYWTFWKKGCARVGSLCPFPNFNTSIIRKIDQSVKNYFSLPESQSAFSFRN